MTLSINAKTYTGDAYGVGSVGYVGPSHTLSLKDYAKLARIAPKPTTTNSGVGKTSSKLTRTLALTGALTPTWDAIIDVSVSIPVGAASGDIDTLLNDIGAFVASATYKTHVKSQLVAF